MDDIGLLWPECAGIETRAAHRGGVHVQLGNLGGEAQ